MKFVALSLPAIPASPEERQQLRPIGHRTDKWQQMIEENVTLAQMLDDYGWEAYTPTTSLEGVDQIYPRRIAGLRSQSTSESGLLHPRKSLC